MHAMLINMGPLRVKYDVIVFCHPCSHPSVCFRLKVNAVTRARNNVFDGITDTRYTVIAVESMSYFLQA